MFDFIYQEEFWMETIIAAIITGAFAVIAALITYNYQAKKAIDKLNEIGEHKDLSNEHKKLSNGHKRLSREHDTLKDVINEKVTLLGSNINENKEITRNVEKMLIEDKTKSEMQYNNLTEKQKIVIDSVENIKALATELKNLQQENSSLVRENKELKELVTKLEAKCRNYEKTIFLDNQVQVDDKTKDVELER